ncbi:Glycosyltransferase [Elusimicrobium minutum Pei191]|uniref:Glycosyltransferase n=1 Tax=Elusimicrobium minutum (strain Pei191) TaxID=445932 RepID=B2KCC2_ELUMP|nr:glycosyltransferase [Elusimicrobium minutum]ACC98043.1 Glycosyltransferase [Elusimicrobium minutum Pei191]
MKNRDNRVKILYIITRLDAGGAQKSVLYSAANLSKNKFKVFLAAGPGGVLDPFAKKLLKNKYFYINSLRQRVCFYNLFYDLVSLFQTAWLIIKIRPHIIHTNCPKAGVVGRAAAFLTAPKTKVIHTYHGLGFSVYGGIKRYLFYSKIEKYFSFITDQLVFVSNSNMQEALTLGIGNVKKNILIYPGAEFEKLKPSFDYNAKLESLRIPKGAKVILSIGNFKPLKNARDFVLVAKHVLKKIPGAYFLYAGCGGMEERKVKTLAKKSGLKNHLFFLGMRHDTRELLAVSDLYVSTSLREGMPVALLEALGAGVPAVCYEADGTAEVLINGKNGFILGQRNKEGMSDKIIEILKNDKIYFTIKQGVKSFDKNLFSAVSTVRKQEELYNKILLKNPGS